MKNRKKIVAALMAMVMCLSFTACNKNTEGDTSTVENTSSEDSVASESSVAEDSGSEDAESSSSSEEDEEDNSSDEGIYPISDEIKNASLSDGLIQVCNDVFQNGGYMTVSEFAETYSIENGGDWDMSWKPVGIEMNGEISADMLENGVFSSPIEWQVTNETGESKIAMNLICAEPADGTTWGDMVIVRFEPFGTSIKPDIVRVAGQKKNNESVDDIITLYNEQGFEETTYDDNFLREENVGKYAKNSISYEGKQSEYYDAIGKNSKPNLYGYEPIFCYRGIDESFNLNITKVQYKDECIG